MTRHHYAIQIQSLQAGLRRLSETPAVDPAREPVAPRPVQFTPSEPVRQRLEEVRQTLRVVENAQLAAAVNR